MKSTSKTGNIAEAKSAAALMLAGFQVALPFGSGHRYDLVIEKDGQFQSVQCKSATYRKGKLRFVANSVNREGKHTSYSDVDLFAVYSPDFDRVYLVPTDLVPSNDVYLRIDRAKNNQSKGIRWAKDFELSS